MQDEGGVFLWFLADQEVSVSTSRPETMLGDVAVAVHPDDPQYQVSCGIFSTAQSWRLQRLLLY